MNTWQEAKQYATKLTGRTPRWCDVRNEDDEMSLLTQTKQMLESLPVEAIEPTGATLIYVQPDAESVEGVEWEALTGARYPTLDSVPWQARDSAVKVAAR